MSDGDVHADLREEADRWSAEHAEMRPPPPPPAAAAPSDKSPASSSPTSDKQPGEASDKASSSSSSTSDKPPSPEARRARFEMAEKIATFIWGVADVFVPKYLGARMKLDPGDEAKLVKVTVPVVEKRLPKDLDGEISDEEILFGTIAMVYGPKYFAPEPEPKKEPTPPGGDPATPGASGTSTPTSATVDGKPVEAQVLA